MLGSRAVWKEGWKAVSVHPTIAGWGHFDEDRWELFHTDEDPTESRDLAAENPEKLQELIDHWFHLADLYDGLPLIDKTPSRCCRTRAGRRSPRREIATSTTRTRPRFRRPPP